MSKSGQEKMEVVIRSSREIAFLGMSKNSQKKSRAVPFSLQNCRWKNSARIPLPEISYNFQNSYSAEHFWAAAQCNKNFPYNFTDILKKFRKNPWISNVIQKHKDVQLIVSYFLCLCSLKITVCIYSTAHLCQKYLPISREVYLAEIYFRLNTYSFC